MDSEKVALIQQTISWLNETFIPDLGMTPLEDLPCGDKGQASSCVIAIALSQNVPMTDRSGFWSIGNSTIEWHSDYGFREWSVPDYVGMFIARFDGGEFPELDTDPMVEEEEDEERYE